MPMDFNAPLDIFALTVEEEALGRLPQVDVGYRSALNRTIHGVLDGTRTEVLQTIIFWAKSSDLATRMYIISGGAGTGKSTIAFTVAQMLEESNQLGGSFFFARDSIDVATSKNFAGAIALQLASSFPLIRPSIIRAIKGRRNAGPFPIAEEFRQLILDPLSSHSVMASNSPPVTIVIDALDECTDREGGSELFRLLSTTLPSLSSQDALDQLYCQILHGMFDDRQSTEHLRLSLDAVLPILGFIVLIYQPLSPTSLSLMLQHDENSPNRTLFSIKTALYRLGSVILVPIKDEDPIRMVHASFQDFITNQDRCRRLHEFGAQPFIDPEVHHAHIASTCLNVLQNCLQETPLSLPCPYILNSKIPNLSTLIRHSIPPHVQYAALFGLSHLICVQNPSAPLIRKLINFLTTTILQYLEVLSLMSSVGTALRALGDVHQWYRVSLFQCSLALPLDLYPQLYHIELKRRAPE